MTFNGLNFLFDGNIDRGLVFSNTLIYFSFCYYETYFIMFWVKPKAFDEKFQRKRMVSLFLFTNKTEYRMYLPEDRA